MSVFPSRRIFAPGSAPPGKALPWIASAEPDLFWQARGQNWGAEFKYEDAPRSTRSMQTAIEDLELERLWVVYPGKAAYRLTENIQVIPLADIGDTWNYG